MQADLRLCWSHIPHCCKSHIAAHFMSKEFQLLVKTKMLKILYFSASKLSDVFILLINVKMPTLVGILSYTCWINFRLN